ncbi:hypothetical protein FKM82_025264 [Ascaphus truei]
MLVELVVGRGWVMGLLSWGVAQAPVILSREGVSFLLNSLAIHGFWILCSILSCMRTPVSNLVQCRSTLMMISFCANGKMTNYYTPP